MATDNLTAPTFRYETFAGNTRAVSFALRNKKTGKAIDLSTITGARLEWRVRSMAQASIAYNPAHPDTDLVNGIVVFEPSPDDLTASAWTADVWITVLYGAVESTLARGQIEVLPRPGYPPLV